MDLSGLKWPIIIVVVVAIGWLFTSGGVSWMITNFTKSVPGEDAARDARDEAGLTRIGGYLLIMWRYEKAADVLNMAVERYPNGKNYWYNAYRNAKCEEKMEHYQKAYNILQLCMQSSAGDYDERIPSNDNLALRAAKLKELYDLQ